MVRRHLRARNHAQPQFRNFHYGNPDPRLRLDSFDYPELFFFNAVANYYLSNSPLAEKNVRQALKLDTQHRFPQSEYLLGLLLLQRQDYADAA